jgi:hypothetical protein
MYAKLSNRSSVVTANTASKDSDPIFITYVHGVVARAKGMLIVQGRQG